MFHILLAIHGIRSSDDCFTTIEGEIGMFSYISVKKLFMFKMEKEKNKVNHASR